MLQLLWSTQMTKVLLLASQHGNELLGERLYKHLQLLYPEYLPQIDFMIANPMARDQGLRYVETDLNRSYNKPVKSYEEKQATKIRKYIESTKPTIVLDLHTTTCNQPPCFIIASVNNENIAYLKASHISRVVIMSNDIVKHSLIGNCQNSVSIEISDKTIDTQVLNKLSLDIVNFLNRLYSYKTKHLFEVNELLMKSKFRINNQKSMQNFRKSKFGFYPILVGEQAYKKDKMYFGFKADKRQIIKL